MVLAEVTAAEDMLEVGAFVVVSLRVSIWLADSLIRLLRLAVLM